MEEFSNYRYSSVSYEIRQWSDKTYFIVRAIDFEDGSTEQHYWSGKSFEYGDSIKSYKKRSTAERVLRRIKNGK